MAGYFFVSFVRAVPSDLYKSPLLRYVETQELSGIITFRFILASMFDFARVYTVCQLCILSKLNLLRITYGIWQYRHSSVGQCRQYITGSL